jgi:hypothetical protein
MEGEGNFHDWHFRSEVAGCETFYLVEMVYFDVIYVLLTCTPPNVILIFTIHISSRREGRENGNEAGMRLIAKCKEDGDQRITRMDGQ